MFVAKVLAAIGLLAIAGGFGFLFGKLEEKWMKMILEENIEREHKKGPKYKKKCSIFAKIFKK